MSSVTSGCRSLLIFWLTVALRWFLQTALVRVNQPIAFPWFGPRGWCPDTLNMLLFWLCVKLLCEVGLLALLGQGVLHLLAGPQRERNFFYGVLRVATRPLTAVARKLTPARVAEHHLPWVAAFLLAVFWLVATLEKLSRCLPSVRAAARASATALGCQ